MLGSRVAKSRGKTIFFAGSAALLFGAFYAGCLEPRWIEVTHHQVPAPVSTPLKIAVLADLHTSGLGGVEARVLEMIERESPDLILLPGDLVHNRGDREGVSQVLRQLKAPQGVFYVVGNWEHWRLGRPRAFSRAGEAQLLLNEAKEVVPEVWLIGLDDALSGTPSLTKAIAKVPESAFRIGMFHSPAFFDHSSKRFDLAISGHTHGGQVRLPGIGALWLPPASGAYEAGWYARGKSKMYVSRGIGMSILPFRFLCRPELTIIELRPIKRAPK